ncbi:MAG: phage tail protein [Nitrospirota bacterium]|nr:phage tail protein [Nitrospirota bacterium]
MIGLDIRADVRNTERWLTAVQKKAVPKAASMAMNRVTITVRKDSVRGISRATALKQKRVREAVVIAVKARRSHLVAVVAARPKRINLIEFVTKGKQVPGAFRRQTGVSAKAWAGRKVYKGTFIGRGKSSGKPLVFARTSTHPKPLKAIHGPSIPRTFVQEEINRVMVETASRRWPIEFDRALKFALSRVR